MEEELIKRTVDLETKKEENIETIKTLKGEYDTLNSEKLEIERTKQAEIQELKTRIDTLSQSFAEMLKETLHKMQERIEAANQEWEKENDANMLKRFEEMTSGNNS